MQVITAFPLVDKIIEGHNKHLKADLPGYRNHATRMLNFCHLLNPQLNSEQSKKLELAAAFHDLGLWTHDRLDYLDPSVELCMQYLEQEGMAHWQQEIAVIIDMHHYIKTYKGKYQQLAELFRRADLLDVSLGLVNFGLNRGIIRQVKREIPNAGFHRTLGRYTGRQLLRNPINPLPMVRYRNKYKTP